MKLQRLKELALGATQGEWKTVDHSWSDTGIYPENGGRLAVCEIDSSVTEDTQEHYEAINDANAAYIAAACPANILPFLESYEELLALLKVSACPICDGQGAFYDGHGDVCQCQFCDERAKAITNAEKLNHE